MLQLLVLGVWFRALEVSPGSALIAMGNTQWIAAGHAAKVFGMLTLLPLGFALGGFFGAIVGLAGSQVLLYVTTAFGAHRAGVSGFRTDLIMTAGAAAAVVAGVLAAGQATARDVAPLLCIVVAGTAAMLVWLPFSYGLLLRRGGTLAEILPARD